jgi:type I restriction enzyme R subunit
MARKLAVWFHKSFGTDAQFQAGAFVPPPNPADAEQSLRVELDRLRAELDATQAEVAGAAQTVAQHATQRQAAELAAQQAYADLAAALELASQTENQLAREREDFRARLAGVQQQVASSTSEQRDAVVARAHAQAEAVDLDEAATRHIIDAQLREALWEVDSQTLTYASGARPVKGRFRAIAEWPTANGPADYVLFLGLQPVGVVEAKRKRKKVAAAIGQSKRYSRGYQVDSNQTSPGGPWQDFQVPFLFAANGRPYLRQLIEESGVWFLDARRSTNHPRALENWYTPEGLRQLLAQDIARAESQLSAEPHDYLPLREYQVDAVQAVETGLGDGRTDMLVAMATGTGKTVFALCLIYRLLKARRFRRILFLVDRTSLADQALDKFQNIRLENHKTLPDIYDVKELGDLRPDPDTRLHLATVQGMVQRLLYAKDDDPPVPIDWYDCIIVDECHRGYNLDQEMSDAELSFRSEADYISKYRRVLDHFDAVRIGLTATPALHTTQIFGPPIYQYTYRQAVIDGWLIDHEPPFRLVTALAQDGMSWSRGEEIKLLDSRTGQLQLFNAPDDVNIEIDEFNRKVVTENFNRTVCKALAEHIDPSLPGKTLIFCVNDLHADLVVRLLKEAFDEQYGSVEDDAVMKITGTADKPRQLIRRFKNEQLPNVVVTVDLLTTGTDVEPIINLVFLRRVRSRILFEQMLGRATRLCPDLFGSGQDKERFRIFDAVDIYAALEDVTQMRPVVTQPSITFTQLIGELQTVTDDAFRQQVKDQLVAKLQRRKFSDGQLQQLQAATGMDRRQLIQHVRVKPPAALAQWFSANLTIADLLDEVRHSATRFIISDHPDELRRVERGYGEATRPEDYLESFRRYVTDHLNELPALVVVTQRPRDLTRAQLRELRLALDGAGFTEANLRVAVREATNQDIAASIIGYIRHIACGQPLVSHPERVQAALRQILAGRSWTEPQRKWLQRIGKQLEQEVIVDREAIDAGQFREQGGFQRLNKVFQGQLDQILQQFAEAIWQVAA